MSSDNSIARSGREPGAQAESVGFDIPADLQSRYEVRLVEAQGGEQRLGLFRIGDRETPAIEITSDRIVTRREDAETIDSLIRIAQHNGWTRIDVDGSPDFRKAIWTAATREGVSVSGYAPTFAEQERVAALRREDERRDRSRMEEPRRMSGIVAAPDAEPALSDADSRVLIRLSALTENRKALHENLRDDMDPLRRGVQVEQIDENRGALNRALERALESPAVVKAFERVGFDPDALRASGSSGEWDTEVADAIFLARTGVHRDAVARQAGARTSVTDALRDDRKDRDVAGSTVPDVGGGDRKPSSVPEEQERPAASAPWPEGEELAELFLHGTPGSATDPRLAGAMQAQTAMQQHIGEVFSGDSASMASANLESRQMISDALRRGLDVSVREPTSVRQLAPMQIHPDLER